MMPSTICAITPRLALPRTSIPARFIAIAPTMIQAMMPTDSSPLAPAYASRAAQTMPARPSRTCHQSRDARLRYCDEHARSLIGIDSRFAARIRHDGAGIALPRGFEARSAVRVVDQRDVDEVLGEEPDLQLVPAQDVAHQQVVRAPVLRFVGRVDRVARLADDRLVPAEQARDHRRDLLGPVRRALDLRQLGGVARVANRDPAERLDTLGEQVDQLELLLGVLVEQQMQLVEGGAGDEPGVLLVERVQDRRVGEDLVEGLAALPAPLAAQADRQRAELPERLDLDPHSVEDGFGRQRVRSTVPRTSVASAPGARGCASPVAGCGGSARAAPGRGRGRHGAPSSLVSSYRGPDRPTTGWRAPRGEGPRRRALSRRRRPG